MKETISDRYAGAADGLRVASLFLISWFHIWQQSWLNPDIIIAGFRIPLIKIVRNGFIFVDVMLLLSGFLAFLPYARHMICGSPLPDVLQYYKKRVVRIVPSYLLCMAIVLFADLIPNGTYANPAVLWRDLLPHLTFTQTFFYWSYYGTKLPGVLWTLAVEMQFYLIFPALAAAFRRKPLLTFLLMTAAAFGYRYCVTLYAESNMIYFNQLIAFLDIYAMGFLGAWGYVGLCRTVQPGAAVKTACLLLIPAALWGIWRLVLIQYGSIGDYEYVRYTQMLIRFPLGVLATVLLLAFSFTFRPVRALVSNRVTHFLSGVSYQYYMWHAYLALLLRRLNIPYSASATPHKDSDAVWQMRYTLIAFAVALAAAVLLTYAFERPVTKRLLRAGKQQSI